MRQMGAALENKVISDATPTQITPGESSITISVTIYYETY